MHVISGIGVPAICASLYLLGEHLHLANQKCGDRIFADTRVGRALVGTLPRGFPKTKATIMRTTNTTFVISALGVALLATPAFADNLNRQSSEETARLQGPAVDEVIHDGRVIGADPDPRIRSELLRDYDSSEGY
jgi:hypothetical protein